MFIRLKWLLYPGVNLHSRLRYAKLGARLASDPSRGRHRLLDAGCGNGMLAYRGYARGATVLGVSFDAEGIAGCEALFHDYLGCDRQRLRFECRNLLDPGLPDEDFDEVVCAEVLEHIVADGQVCRTLFAALKPGGVLHVTTPNAAHPYNASHPLDADEGGGHVRPGYGPDSLRRLLQPAGFEIQTIEPLGGPVRQTLNAWTKRVQQRFGKAAGLPVFLLALLLLPFENQAGEARRPFAWYVRARKPVRMAG